MLVPYRRDPAAKLAPGPQKQLQGTPKDFILVVQQKSVAASTKTEKISILV